jgi:hypothetical protein
MDFAPPVILEIGQREGQQDRKPKNMSSEFLEFSSHIKLREIGAFALQGKPYDLKVSSPQNFNPWGADVKTNFDKF